MDEPEQAAEDEAATQARIEEQVNRILIEADVYIKYGLKTKAIEECIARGVDDEKSCERKNRNFGERSNVGAVTGMFWDLPVCRQALDADRYFKRNPGALSYTPR